MQVVANLHKNFEFSKNLIRKGRKIKAYLSENDQFSFVNNGTISISTFKLTPF